MLLAAGLVVCTSAAAGPVRVIVDGEKLEGLAVEAVFLLPDGTQQTRQSILAGCYNQQGSGLLVYDPGVGTCRPFELALPSEWPDTFELEGGVVVFDTLTRETCLPGECVVTTGGGAPAGDPVEPPDPIFADDFELLLPQS